MERVTEKRLARTPGRLWVGAPALMVLVCVSAQAAPEQRAASAHGAQALALAGGGVACFSRSAREALAGRAAFLIHAVDCLAGVIAAAPLLPDGYEAARPLGLDAAPPAGLRARLDPAHSSRQPSAP